MPYWRLFYQIVWAKKGRLPLIQDAFAADVHRVMADKGVQLGAIVHAVGGIEDHVHLDVSVPPSIALSEFIRQVKGSSSHFVNRKASPASEFAWQADYGVICLGSKRLTKVVQYVREQPQHHRQRTTIPALERLIQETQGR